KVKPRFEEKQIVGRNHRKIKKKIRETDDRQEAKEKEVYQKIEVSGEAEVQKARAVMGKKEFKVIFLNMHGDFRNKINKYSPFRIFLNKQKADIIGCCETKLVGNLKQGCIDDIKIIHQLSYYRALTSEIKPSNGMCMIIDSTQEHKSLRYAILLMGDMNARTKYTGDKVNNQNGNRLMERCQRNALLILNIENCKGQRTFHANKTEAKIFSIVDYAIVNIHEFWEESRIKMEVLKQHVASDHYPIMCTFEQGKTGNTRSMRLHAPYHCRVKLAGNRRPETEELHNILEEINKKIQMNEHESERVNDLIEKYQNEQQKQSQKEIERLLNKIQEQHKKRNDFEVYKRIRLEDKGEWFPVYDE
ncbi:hypothetical protein RFI_34780, partial [Reticulomyxa filosa]